MDGYKTGGPWAESGRSSLDTVCPTCGKSKRSDPSRSESVCDCPDENGVAAPLSAEGERLFAFLMEWLERRKSEGYVQTYSSHVELRVQQEVEDRLREHGWYCSAKSRGQGLDWYCSVNPPVDINELNVHSKDMKYDDLCAAFAIIGPIVGIIYGACNGDILHGFLVGFAIGFLPFLPILIALPFILIWERYFEKR